MVILDPSRSKQVSIQHFTRHSVGFFRAEWGNLKVFPFFYFSFQYVSLQPSSLRFIFVFVSLFIFTKTCNWGFSNYVRRWESFSESPLLAVTRINATASLYSNGTKPVGVILTATAWNQVRRGVKVSDQGRSTNSVCCCSHSRESEN